MSKSHETSSPQAKATRQRSYARGVERKALRKADQDRRAALNARNGYTPYELRRALRWERGEVKASEVAAVRHRTVLRLSGIPGRQIIEHAA